MGRTFLKKTLAAVGLFVFAGVAIRYLLPVLLPFAAGTLVALAAAIMLYAGARENEAGVYEVARGEKTAVLHDGPESLEAFSRLAHDMPAESLAYAALADWEIWGEDLREVDGLEMRITFNLSSIQRIGLRETMRLQNEE